MKRRSIVFLIILSLFSLNIFATNMVNFQEHRQHDLELNIVHEHSHTHYNNSHSHAHAHSIDSIDNLFVDEKGILYSSFALNKASMYLQTLSSFPLIFDIFRPPIA